MAIKQEIAQVAQIGTGRLRLAVRQAGQPKNAILHRRRRVKNEGAAPPRFRMENVTTGWYP